MKKCMVCVLAVLLVFALSVPAFAAEITDTTPGNTVVTYNSEASYIVTIPEDFAITSSPVNKEVKAEGTIESDKRLTVKVASTQYDSGWKLKSTLDDVLAYSIKVENAELANNDTVLSASAQELSAAKTSAITFQVTGTPVYAGTYIDTLTFTVAVA